MKKSGIVGLVFVLGLFVSAVLFAGCIDGQKENKTVGDVSEKTQDDINIEEKNEVLSGGQSGGEGELPPNYTSPTFEEDLSNAEVVVEGIVISKDAGGYSYGMPYEDNIIHVIDYLRNPLDSDNVTVRTLGGTYRNITMPNLGGERFELNERVIVLLVEDKDPETRDVGRKHFKAISIIRLTENGGDYKDYRYPDKSVYFGNAAMSLMELRDIIDPDFSMNPVTKKLPKDTKTELTEEDFQKK